MGKSQKKKEEIREEILQTVLGESLPRDLFSARLYWLFQEAVKEKNIEQVIRNISFSYLMVAKNADMERARAVSEIMVESTKKDVVEELKKKDKSEFALFSGICVTAGMAYEKSEDK